MMTPTEVILHHSATKDSGTVSWGAIRRYHVNECCWGDIGYHFGIEQVADCVADSYEILIGRMPDQAGAHTRDHNQISLGVCFVGSFDTQPVPAAQWDKGLSLVRWICRNWSIPAAKVFGHRQFANKTCPGLLFDLDKFRFELKL